MDLRRPLPGRGLISAYLMLLTSEGRFDNPLPFDGLVAHEGPQLDLQGHLGRLEMKEKIEGKGREDQRLRNIGLSSRRPLIRPHRHRRRAREA